MPWTAFENLTLLAGLAFTLAATAAMGVGEWRGRPALRLAFAGSGLAVVLIGGGLLARWIRLEHGPYVNLFEVLASNVWSQQLALLAGALAFAVLRPLALAAMPIVATLALWLLTEAPRDSSFPVTYDTIWLFFHVWLGKVFLGTLCLASGGALIVLLRGRRWFAWAPEDRLLDLLMVRLVLFAFLFEGGMLIAGAIWAQDAWGRWWDWDPLETWSFLTWLAVVGFLHLKLTVKNLAPKWSAACVLVLYALAFLTFFGIPFLSTGHHQGVI